MLYLFRTSGVPGGTGRGEWTPLRTRRSPAQILTLPWRNAQLRPSRTQPPPTPATAATNSAVNNNNNIFSSLKNAKRKNHKLRKTSRCFFFNARHSETWRHWSICYIFSSSEINCGHGRNMWTHTSACNTWYWMVQNYLQLLDWFVILLCFRIERVEFSFSKW